MTAARPLALLADIGGTNARFALADTASATPLQLDTIRTFAVTEFPSLADAAQHYLENIGLTHTGPDAQSELRHGVFAVAGRVDGDEARITNHPWVIARPRMQQRLGIDDVVLVNDFAAQSMAIPLLQPDDVSVIGGVPWALPADAQAPRTYAVIGPGTGLGVGGLVIRNGQHHPLETEGGHVSFPPGTPEETKILEHLSAQFGRVSNERLICGPGLVNIHRALSEIAGDDPGPLQPADITARAKEGDARCARTVDVFCAVFGAIAGDLVLTLGAWDGVFLTGGLVPKMLESIRHSGFRQRFEHKGRFSPNMARVPTVAVLHPHAGLLGAAAIARRRSAA